MPGFQEGLGGQVAHVEAAVVVEAAGREARVVGDVSLGEQRPAGQGLAQRADASLVAGGRPRAVRAAGEAGLAVKRQPVVLVYVRQDALHRLFHARELRVVVADAGGVEAAGVPAGVAQPARGLEVRFDLVEVGRLHVSHLRELRSIREVEAELQAVQARSHAFGGPLRGGHPAVGGEEYVRVAAVLFRVADGLG